MDRWLKRMSRCTSTGHTHSLKYTVRSGSERIPHGSSTRSRKDGGWSTTGMSKDNKWSHPSGIATAWRTDTNGATAPKATPTLLARRQTAAGTNFCRRESGRTAAGPRPALKYQRNGTAPDDAGLLHPVCPSLHHQSGKFIAGPGHLNRIPNPDQAPTADASDCAHEPKLMIRPRYWARVKSGSGIQLGSSMLIVSHRAVEEAGSLRSHRPSRMPWSPEDVAGQPGAGAATVHLGLDSGGLKALPADTQAIQS